MTPIDIAWLAGFLEGEGHFCFGIDNRTSKHGHVRITVGATSTDEDVIRRAEKLVGGGKVYKVNRVGSLGKKPCWQFALHGDAAVRVMLAILPFMSIRRSSRIKEVIRRWENRPTQKRREFNLPPVCHPDRRHCAKGLCRSCYEKANRASRREWRKNYKRRRRAAGITAWAA